jgi:hypothetical protein
MKDGTCRNGLKIITGHQQNFTKPTRMILDLLLLMQTGYNIDTFGKSSWWSVCDTTTDRVVVNSTNQGENFILYQQNDTCSFSNGKGGLLSYTCDQRTDARYDIKTNGCGAKDDFCDIHNEEIIEVNLTCSNTIYNVKFKIYDSGSSFLISFYNQPNINMSSGGSRYGETLFADSLCPFTHYCQDSVVINNKKYYKVGKLYDIPNYQNIDTVYYNASGGLLRFCMSDSTVWSRR